MPEDLIVKVTRAREILDDRALGRRRWLRFAVVVHLLLAAVVFAPMFLEGKLPIWSTDNYYTHLPNLLFTARDVRAGGLATWNPHVHGGIDYTASAINAALYPPNWPLMLLPEGALFHGLGVRVFLELWLVGVFAYLLFREELRDRRWALFSSVMYQVGGFALWCLTVRATPLILFVTIGLYVVWSFRRRPRYRSFIYLALSAAMVMLGGILPYAFAGVTTLCVLYAMRYWPDSVNPLSRAGYKGTFVAAIATGTLLAMVRLLPVGLSLPESTRVLVDADTQQFLAPRNSPYMGLTALSPDVMGVNFAPSIRLMKSADR
ncbi:hypothetical protein LCGC14_1620940, partial [marine sediment metagenome]